MKRILLSMLFGAAALGATGGAAADPATRPPRAWLVGEIQQFKGPEVATPYDVWAGAELTMKLRFRNSKPPAVPPPSEAPADPNGLPAGAFDYTIELLPDPPEPGMAPQPTEEFFVGRYDPCVEAPGSCADTDHPIPVDSAWISVDITNTKLPAPLRGQKYSLRLRVDTSYENGGPVGEHGVHVPTQKLTVRRPSMLLKKAKLSFPDGACVYGEPVVATFELESWGDYRAEGFHPGIAMGARDGVNVLADPIAASISQTCHDRRSSNYNECKPIGTAEGICVLGTCRYECKPDKQSDAVRADKGDSSCPLLDPLLAAGSTGYGKRQACLPDPVLDEELGTSGKTSCTNLIVAKPVGGGTPTKAYRTEGRVPMADNRGKLYPSQMQRFHFMDDLYLALSEPKPSVVSPAEYEVFCEEALPDLTPLTVEVPTTMIAGEPYFIKRLIRNLRYVQQIPGMPYQEEVSFRYGYYLAERDAEMSANQIPVEMLSGNTATIHRLADQVFTDQVRIPEHLPPGEYQLGLVVNPTGAVKESNHRNNVLVFSSLVTIVDPNFWILQPDLPVATVGVPFRYQLSATGSTGGKKWRSEGLPAGLALDAKGMLSGTPLDAGLFSFKVKVESGTRSSERMLVLRVVSPISVLEVATRSLPPAVRDVPYGGWIDADGLPRAGIPLAASGGTPPYRWEISEGLPSQGLRLENGVISGVPTQLSQSRKFTVKVIDASDAWAERELEISVVDGKELIIASRLFSDGVTGQAYDSCLEATGGNQKQGLTWTIDGSTIPGGLLQATQLGRESCLVGTPTECGNFVVKAQVQDIDKRSYATSIPLSVECGQLVIKRRTLPELRRGQDVALKLEPTVGTAKFELQLGALPTGLVLEEDGSIQGKVQDDAAFGSYNFLVGMSDDAGRKGIGAVTLRVQSQPRSAPAAKEEGGCSSAGGASSGWLLALAGAMIVLRRGGPRCEGAPGWGEAIGGASRRSILLSSLLLAGAVLSFSACKNETSVTVGDRCEGVVCDEEKGEGCDPDDGLCKCGGAGGVFCRPEQVCTANPEPRCGSGLCDFKQCDRGMSCSLLDGECSCGGEVCAADSWCVAGTCKKFDRCEGVVCLEGTVCDPADGYCKCDGQFCGDGFSCVQVEPPLPARECRKDLCAGVNCPTNSECSPRDGSCHCGTSTGAICAGGEACVPTADFIGTAPFADGTEFGCVLSNLCDDVTCDGGTVCDPTDGLCKCGGVGSLAQVCLPGQFCDNGQCKGGKLCVSSDQPTGKDECAAGFSCDPSDGQCKCGGAGGLDCAADEACGYDKGLYYCRKSCEIVFEAGDTSCERTEGCYIDGKLGTGASFCAEAGESIVDAECDGYSDCAPGHYCTGGTQASICRRFCQPSKGRRNNPLCTSSGMPNGYECHDLGELAQQPDLGICIPSPF